MPYPLVRAEDLIAHGEVYQPFNGLVLENPNQSDAFESVTVLMPTASYLVGDTPDWKTEIDGVKLVATTSGGDLRQVRDAVQVKGTSGELTLELTMKKWWTRDYQSTPLGTLSGLTDQGFVRGVVNDKVAFGYPDPTSIIATTVQVGAHAQTNDQVYADNTGFRYVFVLKGAATFTLTGWNVGKQEATSATLEYFSSATDYTYVTHFSPLGDALVYGVQTGDDKLVFWNVTKNSLVGPEAFDLRPQIEFNLGVIFRLCMVSDGMWVVFQDMTRVAKVNFNMVVTYMSRPMTPPGGTLLDACATGAGELYLMTSSYVCILNEVEQDWHTLGVQTLASDPAVGRLRHPGDGRFMIRHKKDAKVMVSYAELVLNELVVTKRLFEASSAASALVAPQDASSVHTVPPLSTTAFVGASSKVRRLVQTGVTAHVGPNLQLPEQYETDHVEAFMSDTITVDDFGSEVSEVTVLNGTGGQVPGWKFHLLSDGVTYEGLAENRRASDLYQQIRIKNGVAVYNIGWDTLTKRKLESKVVATRFVFSGEPWLMMALDRIIYRLEVPERAITVFKNDFEGVVRDIWPFDANSAYILYDTENINNPETYLEFVNEELHVRILDKVTDVVIFSMQQTYVVADVSLYVVYNNSTTVPLFTFPSAPSIVLSPLRDAVVALAGDRLYAFTLNGGSDFSTSVPDGALLVADAWTDVSTQNNVYLLTSDTLYRINITELLLGTGTVDKVGDLSIPGAVRMLPVARGDFFVSGLNPRRVTLVDGEVNAIPIYNYTRCDIYTNNVGNDLTVSSDKYYGFYGQSRTAPQNVLIHGHKPFPTSPPEPTPEPLTDLQTRWVAAATSVVLVFVGLLGLLLARLAPIKSRP